MSTTLPKPKYTTFQAAAAAAAANHPESMQNYHKCERQGAAMAAMAALAGDDDLGTEHVDFALDVLAEHAKDATYEYLSRIRGASALLAACMAHDALVAHVRRAGRPFKVLEAHVRRGAWFADAEIAHTATYALTRYFSTSVTGRATDGIARQLAQQKNALARDERLGVELRGSLFMFQLPVPPEQRALCRGVLRLTQALATGSRAGKLALCSIGVVHEAARLARDPDPEVCVDALAVLANVLWCGVDVKNAGYTGSVGALTDVLAAPPNPEAKRLGERAKAGFRAATDMGVATTPDDTCSADELPSHEYLCL